MSIHKSITAARVTRAVKRAMTSLDNPGFCIACGKEADGCEPDARGYECESCGARKVYGAEELLMTGMHNK
jgi:hypothetical protein